MIADVVSGVIRAGYDVVVVDDGSRDRTGDAAASAGATVIRHPINLGQGAALQTGIAWALRHDADIVVTFDADGQHRTADVARLVAALQVHGADFALGSRFLGGAVNQPLSRRVLLRLATLFTRLTTGLRVTDTHNGLRAMTRRGARAIALAAEPDGARFGDSSSDRRQRAQVRRSAGDDRVQRLFAGKRARPWAMRS